MELWRINQPDRAFCLVSESCLLIKAVEAARVTITLVDGNESAALLQRSGATKVKTVQGCLGLLNSGQLVFFQESFQGCQSSC